MIYAIIGLGVAGITAAKTIRQLDPKGEIHIFSEEQTLYYPRPKLFEVIREEIKARDLYFYDSMWYEERDLKLHLGVKVRKIDPKEHLLLLDMGGSVAYDKLLIANGASCFVPQIEGVYNEGVFTLRNLNDAFKIRRHSFIIGNGKPVVVIGGGVLGLEAAYSFLKNKLKPVVIEGGPYLLPRQLDEEGAKILKGILMSWGIGILENAKTERIIGNGNVEKVILADGTVVPAEMVLLSTGVKPNTSLLELSNLPFNRGALVNSYMQVSEDIFAAGDIAEFNGIVYGIIPPAIEQATIAATNMVKDGSIEYKGSVPSNTLKVVGLDLTSVGLVNPKEEGFEVIRASDESSGKYRKIVLKDNKVVGVIILGIKEANIATKLVSKQVDVTQYKNKLSDINFSLKEISA
ncbi:NAD(P)/FAD-dependent oxidoreductase [Caldisericum exile]|uniref:NAD(P)H-rubredoxin oxidoreductase n=1 Tax=Caldisericum exile (strain DSM 21853 / NBRC 104410 / AZM16c01) TaxID=511051 RepID=A0A7U6GEN3_CALEA|nr:FAD-dependent oxidoreductase [Caldisericum exile]BAL81008.1 putative NAD(P)H-rubredoxin oxidoreductase [Caldisericum exile AZM16c01]